MPKENTSNEFDSEKDDTTATNEESVSPESESENSPSLFNDGSGDATQVGRAQLDENDSNIDSTISNLDSTVNPNINEELALKALEIEEELNYYPEVDDGYTIAHFTDISEYDSTDFLRDPEDFTDVTEEMKQRNKVKVIALSALGFLVLVGISALGYNFFMSGINHNNSPDKTAVEVGSPDDTNNTAQKLITPNLPLAAAYPDAPKTKMGKLEISSIKKNVLTLSNSKKFSITGYDLHETQTDCIVTQPSDFCLAARGSLEEIKADPVTTEETADQATEVEENSETSDTPQNKLNIYLLKDATNSRLMQDPKNFQNVEVKGAQTAGTMNISLAGNDTPVLAIVTEDNSGFLITPDVGSTEETIKEITALTTIASK